MFGPLLRRLRRLRAKRSAPYAAALYAAIVAQARQPVFYTRLGVPDTVMGRYEMIVLHVIVVLERLLTLREEAAAAGAEQEVRAAHELARALQEAMFDSMDVALREVGVSDPGVPKRMEKLVSLFYGQLKKMRAALALLADDVARGRAALRPLLARNIFAGAQGDHGDRGVAALADYVARAHAALGRCGLQALAAGQVAWPVILAEDGAAQQAQEAQQVQEMQETQQPNERQQTRQMQQRGSS